MFTVLYIIAGAYVASRMLSWIAETKPVRISDFVTYSAISVLMWPIIVFMWAAIKVIDHSDKWDKVVIKKKDSK